MEVTSSLILIGAALLLISVFTSLVSLRFGTPLLLVFLAVGLLAGEDGPGGIVFNDAGAAFLIGNVALALILFESGFDTSFASYRLAAAPALTLATLGVFVTTGLIGVAAVYLLGIGWIPALLLGAVLSSTDAAAVFLLLRVGGITIRDRVRSTLEIESGSNDPMAIFMTIALVELAVGHLPGDAVGIGLRFVEHMGGGAALGVVGGGLIILVINRVRLDPGLYPVVSLALALFVFATTNVLGGSGFLAIYVAGLIAGNVRLRGGEVLRRFHSGLSWLGQIVMFVTMGLLATPSGFPAVAWQAVLLAVLLILVARPVAVWLCLAPFRFSAPEATFVAWVGLRGAVSILLALVPILYGLPEGQMLFNVAFITVLASLLVQGWTIGPVARWLGLVVPRRRGAVDRMQLELPGEIEQELVAYAVLDQSPVARGQRLPRWARPSLVIRDGQVVPFQRARQLQAGDRVYLFTDPRTVPLLDRLFAEPRDLDEDDRDFYGDLVLRPETTLGTLAELYGLPLLLKQADRHLADLFRQEFRDPEIGDRLHLGQVDLIAREVVNGAVTSIGLDLEPARANRHHVPLLPSPAELLRSLASLRSRISFRLWERRQRRPGAERR
ncbi:potassium/proton antiporter [Arenibaculum pallidiluteum]|uniref:potassium/proton antiporter n=1 Tax=Arenibaculum pallidiluteum TaxID=2812559 RepID=UPI001A977DFC|nr:potassium/proton antiporter [Arenibaculum pallidiluteum]